MQKYLVFSVVVGFFAFACSAEKGDYAEQKSEDNEDVTQLATFAKVEISVPTIQCKNCVANVEEGIKEVDGVKEYRVDLEKKIAYVSYDEEITNLDKIEESIAMAGYDAHETVRDMAAYNDLDKCCQLPDDKGGNQSYEFLSPAVETATFIK